MAHALEELAEQEDRPEHADEHQQAGRVDRAEGPVGEEPHGEHGVLGAAAVEDEAQQQDAAGDHRGEHGGAGPAVGLGVDQAVDDAEEAAADEERAGDVEAGARGVGLGEAQAGEREQRDAERDVQPEDPVPGDVLGEAAADERAAGDGEAVDRAPDAVGHAAPLGGDGGGEEGEGQRHRDRGADALDGAGGDQAVDAGGERGGGRGGGEYRHADDEEPAPAEAVAEGGAEHEEDGEGEGVGVHRPLEVLEAAAEVLADGGEGGGDDEVVEGRHEAGDAGDHQRPGGGAR